MFSEHCATRGSISPQKDSVSTFSGDIMFNKQLTTVIPAVL